MGGTKHEIHQIKSASLAAWGVETGGRNVEEIVTFIKSLDTTNFTSIQNAYTNAHAAINEAKEAIKDEAYKLVGVWDTESSVEAQTSLQQLYITMGELANKIDSMREPVKNLGAMIEQHQAFIDDHYKGVLSTWVPQGVGGIGSWNDSVATWYSVYAGYFDNDGKPLNEAIHKWGSPDHLAGLHLQTFGNDLIHIYNGVPSQVETNLRDITPPTAPVDDPPPVEYPPGLTGDDGGTTPLSYDGSNLDGLGDTDGPSFDPTDPSTPGYDGLNSDGTNPGGTDPNGGYPPGATPVTSTANPNGGVDPSALNRNPSGNGNDPTTSLADYTPPTGNSYPTTSTPTNTYGYGGTGGGGPLGAAPGGFGGRTASTSGMPFLPMGGMGGGGGADSQERESTTWLQEDDDVWNDDTPSVNGQVG